MAEKYKYLKFDEVVADGTAWVEEVLGSVRHSCVGGVAPETFTARRELTRDTFAKRLNEVLRIVNRQNEYIKFLEKQAQELKSNVIMNQGDVIDMQKELISAKEEQLSNLKITVVSSVEDTVKSELKSYSAAVQESKSTASVIDRKVLKTVVKDVVAEEDRTRNLMIFGLREETNKQINDKISEILFELGEKPKIEASRIGLKSSEKKPGSRPVKITVTNSTIVQQIMSKARNLRNSDSFKDVFIRPDRSVEQRLQQRELVQQMKVLRESDPDKRHYIKGGHVISVARTI